MKTYPGMQGPVVDSAMDLPFESIITFAPPEAVPETLLPISGLLAFRTGHLTDFLVDNSGQKP